MSDPSSVSDEDESRLRAKIDKLLQVNGPGEAPHFPERCLVALVLLTRLADRDVYQSIWAASDPQLHEFLVSLVIREFEDQNNDTTPSSFLYARLAAQLLSRLDANVNRSAVDSLGKVLLHVLEYRRLQKCCLGAVDVEIVTGIQVWLASLMEGQDTTILDSALSQFWLRYVALEDNSTMTVSQQDDSMVEGQGADTPDAMMKQVLTSLLDQGGEGAKSPSELWSAWQSKTTRLFLDFGWCVAKKLQPTFWQPLLRWWLLLKTKKNEMELLPTDIRQCWAQVLLLCTRYQASLSVFQDRLDHDSKLAADLVQLILACIVSTEESDELRAIAWSTVTSLVGDCGWDWLLMPPSNSTALSSLGRASKITSIVRLASGEWKIQLGLLSHDSACLSEERILLVQACAQLLLETVQFVVQLANQMDEDSDKPLPLSGEALLHLRRSLEEALNSSVQYLGLGEVRSPHVDIPVVRVLGALLAEFDVFEKQYSSKEDANENETLHAVRVALDVRDIETQESLLPALASIFASSEGNEERISLLREYDLLGEPFLSFMEAYWSHTSNYASAVWASEVIELWYSMSGSAETSGLLSSILQWIRHTIEQGTPSRDLISSITAAVGCYITLQGDQPPEEPDATILQRALEFGAQYEASL